MYVHMGACRVQKMSNPLELELQVVMNCLTRVLENAFWSSARAVLHSWAISPAVPAV